MLAVVVVMLILSVLLVVLLVRMALVEAWVLWVISFCRLLYLVLRREISSAAFLFLWV